MPLRYAPFLGLAAVQLLLVAIAPSIDRSASAPGALAPVSLASQLPEDATAATGPGGAGATGGPRRRAAPRLLGALRRLHRQGAR